MDGFELLRKLRAMGDSPPTIVLTGYGSIESAVKTVHELGAYWFLEKPIQASVLEALVRRAAAHNRLRNDNRSLETQLYAKKGRFGDLVGVSPKMQEIFALLQQAGPSKACVADHRRERHGERDDRAGDSPDESAAAGSVSRHQLRGAAGESD